MLVEQEYTCPRCWQANTITLDLSVSEQTLIQDCEVCCSPIEFHYTAQNGELMSFEYVSASG